MSTSPKPKPEVNRLHDIVVEEVSLVDHAANKHRFLIVKRSEEMNDDTNTQTPQEDAPAVEAPPSEATTEATEAAPQTSDSQDETLSVAAAALEGLTEVVEQLEDLEDAEAQVLVTQLASELSSASQRLAEAVGVDVTQATSAQTDTADEPTKDAPDLKALTDSVRATLERINELSAGQTDTAPEPEGQESSTKENTAQLKQLVEAVRALTDTVKQQQQRLTKLEKRFGLPNSAPSGEQPVKKSTQEEVGWPMDLNSPYDRESVDKSTSFHDL